MLVVFDAYQGSCLHILSKDCCFLTQSGFGVVERFVLWVDSYVAITVGIAIVHTCGLHHIDVDKVLILVLM